MVLDCANVAGRAEKKSAIARANLNGRIRASERILRVKRTTLQRTVSVTRNVAARLRAGFALAAASHQLLNGFARRFSVMQDGVHLLGDGHFYASRASQADGCGGSEDSFCDHAVHGGDDVGELFPATEFDAYAAIAGQTAGTGKDEVAEARESSHGFGAPTASHHEPRHLGQAASDESGCGIVAETQSVGDSSGDGDHVLQGAAQFHADHVVVRIDAET